MGNISQLINWHPDILALVALDLVIAVLLLVTMRRLSGIVANVSFAEEIAHRDNFAFGISFAGGLCAVTLVLTGAVSGEAGKSLLDEALLVLAYGLLGIALMAAARFILDKISLPDISIHDQLQKGNTAAAIVDAGNMIATAIIVRAVMIWVEGSGFFGMLAVISGFVVSQILLTLVTKYRGLVYAKRHHGESIQKGLEDGNNALAMRYFGHKIGVAMAVTAASGFVAYEESAIFISTAIWGGFSLIMTVLLSLIAIGTRYVVLAGIDVVEEVDRQRNIGVGMIEAVIYIAIGMLLSGLIA